MSTTAPVLPQVVDWDGIDADARRMLLRRPTASLAAALDTAVRRTIAQVRADGDGALRALTRRYDHAELDAIEVDAGAFAVARAALPEDLVAALEEAAGRIEAWHRAGMAGDFEIETAPGVRCGRMLRGIRRVGLYIPAGSAPLPSTALMLGIPARLAGCEEIVACTPPRPDGSVDPAVLAACAIAGVRRVFRIGGAQAIAAMAYGTASVPRCDKLFGPGNAYVTAAKQVVAQDADGAAIDMPAGPSEVLVIADAGARADFIAADLLSQAEHGPDSQTIAISDDRGLLERVAGELGRQLAALPRADIAARALEASRLLHVADLEQAFAISNDYAPEHLILQLRAPEPWLDRVRAAGSVFCGDHAPEALGDYCSGTNHVLPTAGHARALSGVSVASFQTAISVQHVSAAGLRAIGPCALRIAQAEGLDAHARAVSVRLDAEVEA
ncbi:histidinol dehydrogenase [Coralloluteibacterium stylophorae]|uniref:Histidinol dehydrogenase n=1 Tax=Coralloluteibacterium stylophorae TaxID=1776034 RepID=A0A8J7VSI8_9GAMM|nr:histidinol dehydrogenase [Coralloluteibacterium stylophorae]MBS7455889.1 histidinol dehydrogenase [Coralloluteibacterium stylophorae]